MTKREKLAIALFILCTAGIVAGVVIKEMTQGPTVRILTRAPEKGNFTPQKVTVSRGETVRLLVRNVDTVSHGFAIPALGVDAGEIKAGNSALVELTPQETGEFSFYCTVWCSEDHFQMKGTLEVLEPPGRQAAANPDF